MIQDRKQRSTKRVLDFLRGEPPAPLAPGQPAEDVPPLPEMEMDEDEDLAMLPLTKPSNKSKMFRR